MQHVLCTVSWEGFIRGQSFVAMHLCQKNSHYAEYRALVKCIVFYWVDMVVSINQWCNLIRFKPQSVDISD